MSMRHLNCGLIELKLAPASAGTDTMSFEGYGAVFGNVDAYGDIIEPGAFSAYLADVQSGKQNWPAMLLQHGGYGMTAEDMMPVGVFTSLAEDGKGLKLAGALADIQRARDAYTLMKMQPRPAIDGLSIGYIAKEWEPRSKPDDPRRRLKRIDLVEISLVTFPANGQARVDAVKRIEEISTLTEVEDYLREAGGFSRNEAKAIIARIKSAQPREAAEDLKQITDALNRNISILQGAPK